MVRGMPWLALVSVVLLSGLGAARADDAAELAALRAQVAELEKRVALLEQKLGAAAAKDEAAAAAQQARRARFEQRMAQDAAKYTPEQLRDAEAIYQIANRRFGTPEARQALEKLLTEYPDLNRTGCAVLYMGQMSRGAEREAYLKQAIEKHSDCCYGDGVVVGAYARYHLAAHYVAAGRKDAATALARELIEQYPDAIDHQGNLLAPRVRELASP